MFQIQPLTPSDLFRAQALAAELFPWEDEHAEALAAAAGAASQAAFLTARGLAQVRALCVRREGEVVGLASLYDYRHDPGETWLAWFGLSSSVRGLGLGSVLLDRVIQLTRSEDKAVLRLWTTIEDEYAAALQLYARRGFRPELQPALPGEDWQTVVLSLGLDGRVPPVWQGSQKGRVLCGRMIPAAA